MWTVLAFRQFKSALSLCTPIFRSHSCSVSALRRKPDCISCNCVCCLVVDNSTNEALRFRANNSVADLSSAVTLSQICAWMNLREVEAEIQVLLLWSASRNNARAKLLMRRSIFDYAHVILWMLNVTATPNDLLWIKTTTDFRKKLVTIKRTPNKTWTKVLHSSLCWAAVLKNTHGLWKRCVDIGCLKSLWQWL